jgi:hypothetical protein
LSITIIIGCSKELKDPEDDLIKSVVGWEISKTNYDFDITYG